MKLFMIFEKKCSAVNISLAAFNDDGISNI